MTHTLPPLLQINGKPFYEAPDYLKTTQESLAIKTLVPAPIYRVDLQNTILRHVKDILFAPFRLVHGLVGRYVIRAYNSTHDFNQNRANININGGWKFLRTTIEVDGYFADCLIAGNPSMLASKKVMFHLQDDSEFYEQDFDVAKLDNVHLAHHLDATLIAVNLAGVGANKGFPSLEKSKKICRAVFEMIQNKDKGLAANQIIISGHGVGAAIQTASLPQTQFNENIKKVSFLNKSFTQMSGLMSFRAKEWASKKWNLNMDSHTVRLIGFLAAQMIKISGWEINTSDLLTHQTHSSIVYNNAKRKDGIFRPSFDGEIPEDMSLMLVKDAHIIHFADLSSDDHNASYESAVSPFAKKIDELLTKA